MRRSAGSGAIALVGAVLLIAGLLAAPGIGVYSLAVTPRLPLSSWNPHVNCTPTAVRITDITANVTGFNSFAASQYSPGLPTPPSPPGADAKRWLANVGSPPPGWIPAGPGCSNVIGSRLLPIFVEIDGVGKGPTTYEDLRTNYNPLNGGTGYGRPFGDTTQNIYDPVLVPNYGNSCLAPADPTCSARIHVEIDGDWMAANYAGPSTAYDNNNTIAASSGLIDVQGYIYWDGGQCSQSSCTQQWHSFNGWELHPLTAWRPHVTPPPPPTLGTSFTFSPMSPVAGSPATFSASVAGGTAPYNYCWTFGDVPGALCSLSTSSTATKTYGTAGTYTVVLTVTDSSSPQLSATATSPIVVVAPTPALTASFGFSPGQPSVGQTVGFNSIVSGGVPPYTATWQFGDTFTATGLTATHAYGLPGGYTVTLAVTDTATPTPNSVSTSKTVQVIPIPPPKLSASATWSPTIAIKGQAVTFTATVNGGTPPYSYAWIFGDAGVGSLAIVQHVYANPGTYNVTLTVSDSASSQTTVLTSILVQNPSGSGGGGGGSFTVTLPPNWILLSGSGAALITVGTLTGIRRRPRLG
jgi:PKD repeat protein